MPANLQEHFVRIGTKIRKRSIRARLFGSIFAFVLLSAILVAYLAANVVRSNMAPQIGMQHELLVRGVAERLDTELAHRIDELRGIAEAVTPAVTGNTGTLRERVLIVPSLTTHFWNIGIIDKRGNVLTDVRGTSSRGLNIASRPHFQRALSTKLPVVSEPLRTPAGKSLVVITLPVLVDGEVAFLIGAGVDLEGHEMSRALYGGQSEHKDELVVISDLGMVVAATDPAWIMRSLHDVPSKAATALTALGNREGWTVAKGADGNAAVFSRVRLNQAGWTVLGTHPSQTALSMLDTTQAQAIAAAVALALAGGLLGWLLALRVIDPLQRLRQQVAAIERGASDGAQLRTDRSDEIGELSNQFHRLIEAHNANEARLREQESFVRSLLEGAPDAVVLCDAEGVVIDWNRRAHAMFGWSSSESVGRKVADLIVPESLRQAHQDGMARFATSGTGKLFGNAARLEAQRQDGSTVNVELSLAAIPQSGPPIALAFIRDVTRQIEREERILVSERRLQMVADNVPALIAYVGRDQRYVFSNAHYRTLLGIDPASMIGKHVSEVLGPEMYGRIRDRVEAALAGETVHFEISSERQGQTLHQMTDLIPDRQPDGQVQGFYTLVTDITERKEAELKQAESEQRAAAASRAKSEFVANISHEIRTPMNAVLGIAQLLENTPLREDQREYLNIIRASGLSLIAILNDVLDFSKIEAGRMEIEHERYDIESVIDGVSAIMAVNAINKEVDVQVGVGAEVPRFVLGDIVRIQQVISNLVSNAVKFTDRGHVALQVEVVNGGQQLRWSVDDTGIGISREQQNRIFDSFVQADTSTTRKFGGSGLGLAITRRLVQMMGGDIDIISSPGQGAMFMVTVPLARAPAHALPRPVIAMIVLVDPSENGRSLFLRTAAYCGFSAYAFGTVEELLHSVHRKAAELSLVTHVLLSAKHMKSVGEICDRLQQGGMHADSTVCIVAAPFERRDLPVLGAVHQVINKPLTPRTLRQLVKRTVEDRDAPGNSQNQSLRGLRILLIEDNEVNQLIAKGMLADRIASLEVANNGKEGVETLRARPDAFDLVLMDVQMPVMDGYEASLAIRNELHMVLPIVAMTAGVMQEERQRCADAGMTDFVAKPVVMEELLEVLNRHTSPLQGPQPPNEPEQPTQVAAGAPAFAPALLEAILKRSPPHLPQLTKTVRDGIARAKTELLKIDAAIKEGDATTAQKLLHGLRGGLGTLGAKRFADETVTVQAALSSGEAVHLDVLREAFDDFVSDVEHWLETHARNGAELTQSSPDLGMDAFLALLRTHDVRAVAEFSRIKDNIGTLLSTAEVEAIQSALERFEFETASELLHGHLTAPRG